MFSPTVTVPGQAFDEFLVDAAPISAAQPRWTEGDPPLPAMFLSHGAPPLFDDAVFMKEMFDWAQTMAKPTSILIVSAHWEQAPLAISNTAANTTPVYDFGGFARRFYDMRYDTPDASELGDAVTKLLPQRPHEHTRGLDHGAWIPLKVMYPHADVPVVQLSLPTQDPEKLIELGARLRELREQGVLIIGSGFMTHGLPFVTADMVRENKPAGWSADFDAWAAEALARTAVDELADYRTKAPGMPYAHPTVEHYVPLFVTLGASTDALNPPQTTISGYMMGLSKRSFQVA